MIQQKLKTKINLKTKISLVGWQSCAQTERLTVYTTTSPNFCW